MCVLRQFYNEANKKIGLYNAEVCQPDYAKIADTGVLDLHERSEDNV